MAYPISDVTRRIVYSGSAGVGPYSFAFEVLEQTDIAVYKNTSLLTLTTDYTVTINVDGTGSVTLVVAATGSDQITIVGDRAVARSTDFVTGGDLFANSLNDEFDSLVIFTQQVKETADRGLKAAITDPTDVNMTLPDKANRKGKVLAFDSTTGDPVSGPALDSMVTVIAQSANINTVADNIADVVTVATDLAGSDTVGTVAGIASDVSDVAGIAADVTTVADNIADVQNAEENADAAIAAKDAAVAAQSAAEAARDATLAAYDSFDDRYLGAKASDPALDNDGNALVAGSLYYNTTVPEMRLYTGSAWVAAYVSGAAYLASANNLSDLTDAATARQNLGVEIGVDVQAYDATIVVDADIGVSVQAYDADTAKTDVAQTFTASQRGTVTTDNDLSFDLSATNNFVCTPTGTGTLTFTNHTAGQSGFILLDNSSGYPITAAATTKINAADLTTISTAGVYVIAYFDNGTNTYIMVSRSFA